MDIESQQREEEKTDAQRTPWGAKKWSKKQK